MSVLVIPAVDLLDGKVVRLHQGVYDDVTHYNVRPSQMIQEFHEAGASLIHIVDLNAARNGDQNVNEVVRKEVVEAAASFPGLLLEIGGGVRNMDVATRFLENGFHRIIIGTAAVKDPQFRKKALQSFGPEKTIIGVDAKEGTVRVSGWEKDEGLAVKEFLKDIEKDGFEEIIYTDISKDGTLAGPPQSQIEELLDSFGFRIIASGGISSIDDIKSLLPLSLRGLSGIITGKAIYEKKLDLTEAIKLAQQ